MYKLATLGFPRIGKTRELKFALEKYWRAEITHSDLLEIAATIRKENWQIQTAAGIDVIPVGDFSLYDHVLDHSAMFGAVPPRFQKLTFDQPEDLYFSMARGYQQEDMKPIPAMEMTKWFNTNYHYIVPEIDAQTAFSLNPQKLINEIEQAQKLNLNARPVILGPVTFLLLAKSPQAGFDPLSRLADLLPIYNELFMKLQEMGVEWVQLDEPYLSADLTEAQNAAYQQMFAVLGKKAKRPKVMLTAYFADLNLNQTLIAQSPFEGMHIDLVNTPNATPFINQTKSLETLSLGILNGRNIWREDMEKAYKLVLSISEQSQTKTILLAPSCSMLHLPYDVDRENEIDAEVRAWMAFAQQKLEILSALGDALEKGQTDSAFFRANQAVIASRRASKFVHAADKHPSLGEVEAKTMRRTSAYTDRQKKQAAALNLPLFPTTTIGSFPQTAAVRKARSDARKGTITAGQYEKFLKEEIQRTVDFQEQIGIDVLVHGEFERNDMVQYFGEKLSGFAFSKYGWVQSYGSRYVRPPIIFGDVSRPKAMTVNWTSYAQTLTDKPMKGMLTGPVTIMLWSFIRDDQTLAETCKQIAFAIRDEVVDLEAAGTRVIQIDEPALREGLPIQRKGWDDYLDWSVKCFRIASCGVEDKTQIHTHMCYAEFNDIIEAIIALDADVISVEASRSKMELLDAFKEVAYPNEIGPGVYDIHSPTIPTQAAMVDLLEKALAVIPKERLWVNPDCGLKTRRWEEVEPSLKHMVAAAKSMRDQYGE